MSTRKPLMLVVFPSAIFILILTLRLWGGQGPGRKEYSIAVKLVLFEPDEMAPLREGEEGSWYVPTFLEKYNPAMEGSDGLIGLKGLEGITGDAALEARLAEMDPNCSFHVVAAVTVSATPGKLVGEYIQSKWIEFDGAGRWVGESGGRRGQGGNLPDEQERYAFYALWFAMIFDRPSPDGWCLAQRTFRLMENNQMGIGEDPPPHYLRVGEATVYLFGAADKSSKDPLETPRWRPGRFALLFLDEKSEGR